MESLESEAINPVMQAIRPAAMATLQKARRLTYPPAVRRAWTQVRAEHLSYASDRQMHQLLGVVRATAPSGALIIEAGCARGGSAILLCATKAQNRPMRVYDVFDMIPPPSEHDGADMKARYQEIAAGKAVGLDGGRYYLYERDMLALVRENFQRLGYPIEQHNVQLIKGMVQDTLTVDEPVALAHIDVDWFEPVTACLERIVPRLIVGGAVALHAYSDWSGCRKAADAYFNSCKRPGFNYDASAGHLLAIRTQ